jgi:hypothetical protein
MQGGVEKQEVQSTRGNKYLGRGGCDGLMVEMSVRKGKKKQSINSRYSLAVTHPTTNQPTHGLSTAERTGSPVFHVLWSIAK